MLKTYITCRKYFTKISLRSNFHSPSLYLSQGRSPSRTIARYCSWCGQNKQQGKDLSSGISILMLRGWKAVSLCYNWSGGMFVLRSRREQILTMVLPCLAILSLPQSRATCSHPSDLEQGCTGRRHLHGVISGSGRERNCLSNLVDNLESVTVLTRVVATLREPARRILDLHSPTPASEARSVAKRTCQQQAQQE